MTQVLTPIIASIVGATIIILEKRQNDMLRDLQERIERIETLFITAGFQIDRRGKVR